MKTTSKKILMTGGSGHLGSHIALLDKTLIMPSIGEMDITDHSSVLKVISRHRPDIVLHLAAATDPPAHERNPEIGIRTNIIGTAHVAMVCRQLGIRLVYTSSDYLYTGSGPHTETEPVCPPNNFYWSKLGGEAAVAVVQNSLILRLSFGAVPFPWDKVYTGQWNSKLYVDEIAPLVLAAAQCSATGIMNVGGPRTTLEEYAKRTKPAIQIIPKPDWVPADTSLDLSKMQQELGIADLTLLFKH